MKKKYLVVEKKILPEAFEKVVIAERLLDSGQAENISQAVKIVGISRSTFYKYKDSIFTLSETTHHQKVSINFRLTHNPGILNEVLSYIASQSGNIITIHQDIPIHGHASVSITFDMTHLSIELDDLIQGIASIEGVSDVNLIAVE